MRREGSRIWGRGDVDIRESVQQFIESNGFPLEFYTADQLAAGGFVPRHGRTYASQSPSGEAVHREIDVLAELPDTRLQRPAVLAVECKRTRTPWVVIAGERDPEPQLQIIHGRGGLRPLKRELGRATRQVLGIAPPLAFGIAKVKSQDKGAAKTEDKVINREDPVDPFDAIRQVLSAAVGATSIVAAGAIIHPVLVIEGRLFRYEHGLDVVEVPSGRLVWWGSPTGPTPVVVDVVTRVGFDAAYVLELRNDLVRLSEVLGPYQGAAVF